MYHHTVQHTVHFNSIIKVYFLAESGPEDFRDLQGHEGAEENNEEFKQIQTSEPEDLKFKLLKTPEESGKSEEMR